ncbi:MAG: hypothetical protein RR951_06770 [Ruthenibacterium sp.]
MKRKIALVLIASLAAMLLTGCSSNKSACKNTIQEFALACNSQDVNGILDTINPDIADPIKVMVGVSGLVGDTKLSYDVILEQLSGYIGETNMNGVALSDALNSIMLTVEKVKVKSKKAVALCEMECTVAGVPIEREINIYLVKKSGQWYIAGAEQAPA